VTVDLTRLESDDLDGALPAPAEVSTKTAVASTCWPGRPPQFRGPLADRPSTGW